MLFQKSWCVVCQHEATLPAAHSMPHNFSTACFHSGPPATPTAGKEACQPVATVRPFPSHFLVLLREAIFFTERIRPV